MTSPSIRPILVAVDGSPASALALRWAVDEAVRQHRHLHVLHAQVEGSTDVLDDARNAVQAQVPGLDASFELTDLAPARAITEAAAHAQTVVLGARGRGPLAALLLGSVSAQVVHHASCPVVVVKDLDDPERPRDAVVVGVDGVSDSQSALAFAFEHAAALGTALDVVHAWTFDQVPLAGGMGQVPPATYRVEPEEERLLSESLVGWREKYPQVELRTSVVRGSAVAALLEHADGAELLVVGSRGRGGFADLLLGSVSSSLLHRAAAPVAVVR